MILYYMGRRSINGHSRRRRNKASALKRAMAVEATEIETPGSMQVDMSSSPMKATKEELLAGAQSGMESQRKLKLEARVDMMRLFKLLALTKRQTRL